MFTIPRVNAIESDEGFVVEFMSRDCLAYSEGDTKWEVEIEFLAGPSVLAIYQTTLHRLPPPVNAGEVSDADRTRIIDNIRRAFRFRGFDPQVI